jgi:ABC-type multidrug transport system fused ATPase/permease subunit
MIFRYVYEYEFTHELGRVAYCSQTPWIQNLSLRDNILFGKDYNDPLVKIAYEKAISYSALKPDIGILVNGDLTEIGIYIFIYIAIICKYIFEYVYFM